MNLLIRCFLVWMTSFFRKPLKLTEPSILDLVVFPGDLDIYAHMNNGRYLTVMDLGRFDFILRSGLGSMARRMKWNPLVASAVVRYRRPLFLFQRYRLVTRVVSWDERWIYIEQRFEHDGHLVCVGLIKGLFFGARGRIPTHEVIHQVSPGLLPAQPPHWVSRWKDLEHSLPRGERH